VSEPEITPSWVERILPFACLAAALILAGSEFLTTFEITPEGIDPQSAQSAGDRHLYAMAVLAGFSVIALAIAILNGSKAAAIAVAALGGMALFLFLTVDLPDANAVGQIERSGQFLTDAKAVPQAGFWMTLLGSLALTISGIALATLSEEQLRALRPKGREREADPARPKPSQ
jgi:hypothetical protein